MPLINSAMHQTMADIILLYVDIVADYYRIGQNYNVKFEYTKNNIFIYPFFIIIFQKNKNR